MNGGIIYLNNNLIENSNEIIIYTTDDGQIDIEVRLEDENAVVKENLTTAKDGKNYKTKFYNLDLIISVGYRVKSVRGTQFRIWANKLIKEYLKKLSI